MIELDEHGNIPAVTRARVYIVAGYTDGRPWSGLNHWSDGGPMTPAAIEAYPTFQGWACDELPVAPFVDNHDTPTHAGQFRVALFEDVHVPGRRYTALEQGPVREDLAQAPGFLGWISPTVKVRLPKPVPEILVRFRADLPGAGVVEGLFITTRPALDRARGRTVNLGARGGAQDVVITLEARHFIQLSDDQRYLEKSRAFARDGTLCGVNPLDAPAA